jgi:hypothetical protein
VELAEKRFEVDNTAARTQILLSRCEKTGRCSAADERIMNAIDANITNILLWAK